MRQLLTDAEGRFTFDDLNEGTINVFVMEPDENVPWTFRAAQDVELKSGWTKAVKIELITGVDVEGTVVSAWPAVRGGRARHLRPLSAQERRHDQRGQDRRTRALPLPASAGETYFYVMGSDGRLQPVQPDRDHSRGCGALRGAPDRGLPAP